MVLSKNLSLGEFTVISVFFSYLIGAICFFFSFFKSIESTKTSFDRIIEFKNIKMEENSGIKLDSIDSIRINNLSFGYDKTNIINELNKGVSYEQCINYPREPSRDHGPPPQFPAKCNLVEIPMVSPYTKMTDELP